MSKLEDAVIELVEGTVEAKVEAAISDIDWEDEIDLSDYVKRGEVNDELDLDDLADRVRENIDIEQAVKDELDAKLAEVIAGTDVGARVQRLERRDTANEKTVIDLGDRIEALELQLAPLLRVLAAFKVVP